MIKKLQELSERRKKIILWSIIVILGIILFGWWAQNLKTRLPSFNINAEDLEISQELQKALKELEDVQ